MSRVRPLLDHVCALRGPVEKFVSAGEVRKIFSVGQRDSENIFRQIKDQVMAINSVQESSKSELSSGTFGTLNVWVSIYFLLLRAGFHLFPPATCQ